MHADAVFFEQVEWGQRPEMLADGEGRDAGEADEVGQGRPSRGAGISLVEGDGRWACAMFPVWR